MSLDQREVAALLEGLRAEVRARRKAEAGSDPARDALERELRHCAEQLEITRVVSAHWPLEGNNLYEKGWALINKVVRRYLSWYINPIVEQQNAFNDVAARTLRLLIEARAAEAQRRDDDDPPDTTAGGSGGNPANGGNSSGGAIAPIIADLTGRANVSAHLPLGGSGIAGQAKGLAQRIVRQYLRWYINPIVEQQNGFNAALVETARSLSKPQVPTP